MPASSGRRKAGQPRSGSRSRKAKQARADNWRRTFRLLRDLLPLLALLLVVAAVLLFDPEAVARLVWAGMTGVFGTAVQLAVSAVVIGGGGMVLWALWQPDPSAAEHGPASRSAARRSRGSARKDATGTPKQRRTAGRRKAAADSTGHASLIPAEAEPTETPPPAESVVPSTSEPRATPTTRRRPRKRVEQADPTTGADAAP